VLMQGMASGPTPSTATGSTQFDRFEQRTFG
jgi:hypothetical protein